MSSTSEKQDYGVFGIGCATISAAALFLAVAMGIFFGAGWGFLSLALFVLVLGLIFCAAAINSLRKRKVQQMKENMVIKTAGGNDDSD